MSRRHATLRRLAAVSRCLARHGLAHGVVALSRYRPSLRAGNRLAALEPAIRLRTLLEELGGSFIKFGQMLALQPDLVPRPYCDALLELLDRVEPFPYEEVERVVGEELGGRPDEIFDSFEREPIAAASVGQVHVAYVDGRKVAVKVQRPTAWDEFGSDVRLFQLAIRTIGLLRLRPLYWLLEPMNEFVRWTREELDYRNEAAYARRLRSLAVDNPAQHVPETFPALTTRRVLTAEFLDGVTLLDYLRALQGGDEVLQRRLAESGFDSEAFARNVIDNFLGDAFRHGIYHADLHPANLMILPDSVVGYLDFGITGVMSAHSRRHLMTMTLALARGDLEAMYDAYLEITVHDHRSDYDGFRHGLQRASAGWYADGERGGGLAANFTRIMSEMLELSRRNGVMPERDVIKYIRSSIAIDGLITRFVPGFDLGLHLAETCARHLDAYARQREMAAPRLLDRLLAGGHLVEDGMVRGVRALERLLDAAPAGERAPPGRRRRHGAKEGRAVALGVAVVAVSLSLVATPPQAAGLNLVGAELAVLAVGFLLLIQTAWRLAR